MYLNPGAMLAAAISGYILTIVFWAAVSRKHQDKVLKLKALIVRFYNRLGMKDPHFGSEKARMRLCSFLAILFFLKAPYFLGVSYIFYLSKNANEE